MTGYRLAPQISFCDAGGRYVFLDLDADRYFCLEPEAEQAFARLMAGRSPAPADHKRLDVLEEDGGLLVRTSTSELPEPVCLPVAEQSLFDAPVPVSTREIAMAALALLRARRALRARPLGKLVSELRLAKHSAKALDRPIAHARLASIAASFRRAALLAGALDQCLALSLAMTRRALSQGIVVELVLGVKLRPFQAHAWVQSQDQILSDRVDRVAPFTPILVI
ncbi:lasso peptide biosynthesis B2 protein [Sphingomonas sp.]|uniref:lasso peptide biosynthesis B2 protein n=1 Tax=Sphingomonas sp. TaxID=28214 RepID=UPI0031DD5005